MKPKHRIVFLAVLAVLVVGLFLWLNFIGWFYVSPKSFNAAMFRSVARGMTQDEVVDNLGPPLAKNQVGEWNEQCSEYWEYSEKPVFVLWYKRFTVFFDRDHRVLRTTIQIDR